MRTTLSRLLDVLLPTGCVVCRAWIPQEPGRPAAIVCRRCRLRLLRASWPRCPRCHAPRGTGRDETADCLECRPWPSALRRARFAHVLVPPATDLVHALKYEGWRELADPLGSSMARTVRAHLPPRATSVHDAPRLVVPVPTTRARIRARGYNQAAVLADVVASRLDLPWTEALVRGAASESQTSLDPGARRANVRGAFSPSVRDLEGRDVLLVDDVLTTGATACEAARVLMDAGAASVALVTFARALPRISARLEARGRAA